jgi:hypothetical protein
LSGKLRVLRNPPLSNGDAVHVVKVVQTSAANAMRKWHRDVLPVVLVRASLMKPILVVDNSNMPPRPFSSLQESPEIRIAAAWQAMQDVMRNHIEGEHGKEEALEILSGYLSDPRLAADAKAVEG